MQKTSLDYRIYEDGEMKVVKTEPALHMLFTGRFDHQGSKIYDGDILRVNNLMQKGDVKYVIVQWDKKSAGFGLDNVFGPMRLVNKVGNIFEDKELLEGR